MSIRYLMSVASPGGTVGSILHGAYGDYYEQMVCLRYLKRLCPDLKLILFFASESRQTELAVFDLSFADRVLAATEIGHTPVDRFLQFQIRDAELNRDILSKLPPDILRLFNRDVNLKPWLFVREIFRSQPGACDIPLSALGIERLPQCIHENQLNEDILSSEFTVGFLWRYRGQRDFLSSRFRTPADIVHLSKSQLLTTLVNEHGAKILVAGMNCQVTTENRERTDCKFAFGKLDLPDSACIYLKGLNWGLELEIMRRCSLCIAMASGFTEALLFKRSNPTVLVDPPIHYIAKLLWNRMPFFGLQRPSELLFQLNQPHTADRVMAQLKKINALPESTQRPKNVRH